jgi:hypothetical protein
MQYQLDLDSDEHQMCFQFLHGEILKIRCLNKKAENSCLIIVNICSCVRIITIMTRAPPVCHSERIGGIPGPSTTCNQSHNPNPNCIFVHPSNRVVISGQLKHEIILGSLPLLTELFLRDFDTRARSIAPATYTLPIHP